jgi:ABC-2 type transport system permease protein
VRSAKLLAFGWAHHFKIMSRSAFDGFLAVVWPLFFATVAFLMFRATGDEEALFLASLGATVMGMWSVTSTSASSAMQRERWYGTLELLVAAPVHFSLVLLPITLAMSTIGLYCLASTLLWGKFLFGIDLHLDQPLLFMLAVPATTLSIGLCGFLLAVSVVRYRAAWALGNAFEFPVWLICGLLVPLTLLPDWVRPISWALAPTWGMNAIRESATGGSPLPDVAMCLALGLVYTVVGVLILETVLRSARARATLALT